MASSTTPDVLAIPANNFDSFLRVFRRGGLVYKYTDSRDRWVRFLVTDPYASCRSNSDTLGYLICILFSDMERSCFLRGLESVLSDESKLNSLDDLRRVFQLWYNHSIRGSETRAKTEDLCSGFFNGASLADICTMRDWKMLVTECERKTYGAEEEDEEEEDEEDEEEDVEEEGEEVDVEEGEEEDDEELPVPDAPKKPKLIHMWRYSGRNPQASRKIDFQDDLTAVVIEKGGIPRAVTRSKAREAARGKIRGFEPKGGKNSGGKNLYKKFSQLDKSQKAVEEQMRQMSGVLGSVLGRLPPASVPSARVTPIAGPSTSSDDATTIL